MIKAITTYLLNWSARLSVFVFLPACFTVLHSFPLELGGSLLVGNRINYGGDFLSLNAPRGLRGINNSVEGSDLSPMGRSIGISTEAQLRGILYRYFYVATGFEYTSGVKSTGKYLLRNPLTGAFYQVSGENVPVNGSASLSHFSFPLQGGLVLTYWGALRVYGGFGLSYNMANQVISQSSANTDLIEFNAKSEIKPSFFAWHFNLMGEYLLVGSPADDYRLTLNVNLQYTWGRSGVVDDLAKETNLPAGLPLAANDVAGVDLNGYRFSVGLTYYFLRRK